MAETENRGDHFLRGFHDIPGDDELRSLSDLALFELLVSCESGSVKRMAVEAEKRRRELPTRPEPIAQNGAVNELSGKEPSTKPNEWHENPLGKVGLSVAGGLVLYLLYIALKNHFGISL